MFAITRRPSATTPGIVANLPSSSTSCATARVAAAPEPIATPMSASFSASASFTPSPVIATTWPRDCSAPTIARFWCGRDPAERRWCARARRRAASVSSGSSRASNGSSAPGQPDPLRHRADRPRVVARDHLEGDALLGEVAERVGRVGAHLLLEQHERGRRRASAGSVSPVERAVAAHEEQDPPALRPRARRRARGPDRSPAPRPAIISGAPMTHVPWSSNVAALHLRADENGTAPVRVQPSGAGRPAPIALERGVAVVVVRRARRAPP